MRTIIYLPVLCAILGFSQLQAQSFQNLIDVPDTINNSLIEIEVDRNNHDFDPGQHGPSTTIGSTTYYVNGVPTMGYNPTGVTENSYLGPTLIWNHGTNQQTEVTNNIPDQRTTVHWHGAHIPAIWDGGPHQAIDAGAVWAPQFDILDDVTTLWYHPHLEDTTYLHVELGLSGIIIIKDATDSLVNNNIMPHTYGVDDIPLIIQDRQFVFDSTQLGYRIDTTGKNNATARTVIVNGILDPFSNAFPQMMRYRVLNGSSRVAMLLGLVDDQGNAIPIQLTGSDAGYLDAPITVDSFATGPGIRNEFVVDLAPYAGQDVFLKDYGSTLKSVWPGKVVTLGQDQNIMRIAVGNSMSSNPVTAPLPATFPPYDTFDVGAVSVTRAIELQGQSGIPGPQVDYAINGNQFTINHLNDTIMLDSTEQWVVKNASDVAHPFHIHDVHVDIIQVRDESQNIITPFPPDLQGRQDNFLVPAGWEVTFVTTFDDFGDPIYVGDPTLTASNGYMYHCHILTHEDGYYAGAPPTQAHGMMQQFLVWNGDSILASSPAVVEDLGAMIFYPNPANETLYIQGESKRASEFCIFDLTGKMIARHEIPPFDGRKSFDVSGLHRGMYLVQWRDGRGREFSRKISLLR